MDGDTVFAAATGRAERVADLKDQTEIGLVAATCLARAIARAIYLAEPLPLPGHPPTWRQRFGSSLS